VYAAALAGGSPVCAGQHSPVDGVTELAGIGTLRPARRQGLGSAVTAALIGQARAAGVHTVFLSAEDEAVERLYGRLGFRTCGTAMIAG
jgi:ribosomal protein S18 acetylase RimI-like enzyme